MPCTRVNIFMFNFCFFCCFFNVSYKFFIPIYSISIPCLFYYTLTSCPFFICTALYNGQYFFKCFWIFMSCIYWKIKEIWNNSMYTWMAYNFTCCINQLRYPKFINFIMYITKCLWGCIKCIFSFCHWKCACMSCLSIKLHSIIKHSKYAINNSNIISWIFKNWPLFYMSFKHIFIFFWIYSILLVSFKAWFF